jgi:hypothetical protein
MDVVWLGYWPFPWHLAIWEGLFIGTLSSRKWLFPSRCRRWSLSLKGAVRNREGVERLRGRKDGNNLTNIQYKPNRNYHYESSQYN